MQITQLTSLIPRRSPSPVPPRTSPQLKDQLKEKVQTNLQNVLDTWGLGGRILEYLDNPSVGHLMLTSTGISESESGLSFFLSKIESLTVPDTAKWADKYLSTSNTPSMQDIYAWRQNEPADYLSAYVAWKGMPGLSERYRDIALYIASSDELRLAKDMSGKSVQEFISTLKKYYFLAHAFPKTDGEHMNDSHVSAIQSALSSSGATNLTPLLHTLHRDAPSDLLGRLTDELISLTLGANDLDKNLLLSLLVQGEYFQYGGGRPEIWLAALNSSDPEINAAGAKALWDGDINFLGLSDESPIYKAILHMITNSPTDCTRQAIYEFVFSTGWPFNESGTVKERDAILSFVMEHTRKERDIECCSEYLTLLNTHFDDIFKDLSADDTVTFWLKLSTDILNTLHETQFDSYDTTPQSMRFDSIRLFRQITARSEFETAMLSGPVIDTLTKLVSGINLYYVLGVDRDIWHVMTVIDKFIGDDTQDDRFTDLQKEKKRLISLHTDTLLSLDEDRPLVYDREEAKNATIDLINNGYFNNSLNKIDKDLWLATIKKYGEDIQKNQALSPAFTQVVKTYHDSTKEQKSAFGLTKKEFSDTIEPLIKAIKERKNNQSMSPSAPLPLSFEETKGDAA